MFQAFRLLLLILVDLVLVHLSLLLALLIRFEANIPLQYQEAFIRFHLIFSGIFIAGFFVFGLYRRAWKYASIGELIAVIVSVSAGTVLSFFVAFFISGWQLSFPRSVFILMWVLTISFVGTSRLVWRLVCDYRVKMSGKSGKPVLVVGAGDAGVLVAKELKSHYNGSIDIVGFIDDDSHKQNMMILGIPVLGTREDIPLVVKRHGVQEIILALPSAGGKVIREIVAICRKAQVPVKILPGIYDVLDGRVKVSKIREVEVEDLLGREPVKVDLDSITRYVHDKVVLVTGGGGSIGSELCRQVAGHNPKKLLVLDACENSVYDIDLELRRKYPSVHIVSLVKNIRDRKAMVNIFKTFRPQVVFHAAAHKHVPLMEWNPEDAIKNNVMGTYNLAQCADMFSVQKFVLISTDKAVNPTSVMGASKRLAEMVIRHMNSISETSYTAVRFGNVLGSRGSVIPLFKKQIAEGGPVTVTHSEMVRYFMTIPEAVQLVIQAGAIAQGGEVFVLDMGDPVKIMDLARSLIELSGFELGREIEIKITGIRPGEKLYEELLTAEEGVTATTHKRIFVARPTPVDPALIEERIIARIMSDKLPQNEAETVAMIREFLPEFRQGIRLQKKAGGRRA